MCVAKLATIGANRGEWRYLEQNGIFFKDGVHKIWENGLHVTAVFLIEISTAHLEFSNKFVIQHNASAINSTFMNGVA